MLTSCPRVVDMSPTKTMGAPKSHDKGGLSKPLMLSMPEPVFFQTPVTEMLASALRNEQMFVPISSLDMQSGEDWIIKAKVYKKSNKVSYQAGCLFKIELIDEEGTQIEGTFYKDNVARFFDKI